METTDPIRLVKAYIQGAILSHCGSCSKFYRLSYPSCSCDCWLTLGDLTGHSREELRTLSTEEMERVLERVRIWLEETYTLSEDMVYYPQTIRHKQGSIGLARPSESEHHINSININIEAKYILAIMANEKPALFERTLA